MSLERIEGYDAWKTRLPEECPNENCKNGLIVGFDGDGAEAWEKCDDPCHMSESELREYRRWMAAGCP